VSKPAIAEVCSVNLNYLLQTDTPQQPEEQFVAKIQSSRASVQLYESDKVDISFKMLKRIADVCDVDFSYFLDKKNKPQSHRSLHHRSQWRHAQICI